MSPSASTIEQVLSEAATRLRQAGIVTARLDAEVLLAYVVRHERSWLVAHGREPLTPSRRQRYHKLIARRSQHEPVAYLTGVQEFYGLSFAVSRSTLIPRPETEPIVEHIISRIKPGQSLLDIGTGCGAIGLAVLVHRPGIALTLSDVSARALKVAWHNASRLAAHANVNIVQSNLFKNVAGQFDFIAANLPYVPEQIANRLMPAAQYEPPLALYGGRNGLELYRRFLATVGSHLAPHGEVYCEADPWRHAELNRLAAAAGLTSLLNDYFIAGWQRSQAR